MTTLIITKPAMTAALSLIIGYRTARTTIRIRILLSHIVVLVFVFLPLALVPPFLLVS